VKTPTLTVHESRSPARRSAALREALQAHRLPGHLLYEGPGQAQRWLALHQAWSPSRTDAALQQLYRGAFTTAVGALGGGPLHGVSLGCGGGRKDADLLDAVPPGARADSHYTPLDASATLVGEAARLVAERHPGVTQHPIEADLAAEPKLLPWLDTQDGGTLPRLFTCFGMIPNFDADSFPRYLASLVRPQDGLLFSANLSPQGFTADHTGMVAGILRQYDNPEARAWYRGALEALGIASSDFALSIAATPTTPDGSRWQIAVDATLLRRVRAKTGGVTHPLPVGERLRVFFSNRFTPAAIRAILAQAGLTVSKDWLHTSGEEGIFWCRRKA
jgi:uncharacterized SAM-dependent methyltransferase